MENKFIKTSRASKVGVIKQNKQNIGRIKSGQVVRSFKRVSAKTKASVSNDPKRQRVCLSPEDVKIHIWSLWSRLFLLVCIRKRRSTVG